MDKSTWTNREILELLHQIDLGHSASSEEVLALQKLVQLDLRRTKIDHIPESIGYLTSLHGINLSGTRITALPDSMRRLKALRFLDISETNVSGSLLFLKSLENLQFLYLNNTKVDALPDEIGCLANLIKLDLSGTALSVLPDSIDHLVNLKYLNLSGTIISSLPDSIGNLSALEYLNINDTKLTRLPESIGQLLNIKYLSARNTRVTSLPETIGCLSNLERLDLGYTLISALPDSLRELNSLSDLELRYTKISDLPSFIGELPRLRHLDIAGLSLQIIPETLVATKLPFWDYSIPDHTKTGINLHDVTLKRQDISFFLEHPSLIAGLYQEENTLPLNECRVIFLGDGAAGKSYTIKRIHEEGRKETEDSPYITSETPGVEIVDYHVDKGENSFDIHFWDFGGQQILHSMHRCFLTEETCYVIVVKTRETKANERAKYWLRNVRAFAPNSPILLFVNCWENDNGLRTIDEPGLLSEFPKIEKVVYCSAKQAETVDFKEKVMQPIFEMASKSEGISKKVPRQWIEVRKAIREESNCTYADGRRIYYLDKDRYHTLCAENAIDNEFASDLLSFFNNLGVCFSFHRDSNKRELSEYKLLDPVWLTNAIYAIIEEGMAPSKNGRIERSAIEQMLCNRAPTQLPGNRDYRRTVPELIYREFECQYILEVAEVHNLCYKVDENTLFFPALCSHNTPQAAQYNDPNFPIHAEYRFKYEYLPNNVIHQLMIRCLQKGYVIETCWLEGMIIGKLEDHRVIIRMIDDQVLKIECFSRKGHRAWEILPVLRSIIIDINKNLNLKAKEQIAQGTDIFPMVVLIQQFKTGKDETFGSDTGVSYQVSELLEKIFETATLERIEVADGSIQFHQYQYHPASKSSPILRRAIWEAYDKKCQLCGLPLGYDEMQIMHILPKGPFSVKNNQVALYIEQLEEDGFPLQNPDCIENYCIMCGYCNRSKIAQNAAATTMREYHRIAKEKTSQIVSLMDKYSQAMINSKF